MYSVIKFHDHDCKASYPDPSILASLTVIPVGVLSSPWSSLSYEFSISLGYELSSSTTSACMTSLILPLVLCFGGVPFFMFGFGARIGLFLSLIDVCLGLEVCWLGSWYCVGVVTLVASMTA